jgi:hypothetical protein
MVLCFLLTESHFPECLGLVKKLRGVGDDVLKDRDGNIFDGLGCRGLLE